LNAPQAAAFDREEVSQLHINIHDLLWAIVNFTILLAILYKFLYGPVLKMMESRTNEINNNINQAETVRSEAESLRAKMAADLTNARKEAQEIINTAGKAAEEMKNEIIAQARESALVVSTKAQEEIQREKEQALADIRNEVANLAILAAGKVLGDTMSVEQHRQQVDKFIQEVGGVQ